LCARIFRQCARVSRSSHPLSLHDALPISSAKAALSSSAAATSKELASRALPTAAELDAQIKRALDPALPDSERTKLIEDGDAFRDRKSTRLNSSHVKISYAVFCLKKKSQR